MSQGTTTTLSYPDPPCLGSSILRGVGCREISGSLNETAYEAHIRRFPKTGTSSENLGIFMARRIAFKGLMKDYHLCFASPYTLVLEPLEGLSVENGGKLAAPLIPYTLGSTISKKYKRCRICS